MKKKQSLAIVIPAYKATFLKQSLESIVNQTCLDFNLYIGDDCSPYNLGEIIAPYKAKINITYKRFETNIGGKDLVAQWDRCIDLIQDEEWIWLFSDDDIMDKNCVEEFYKQQKHQTSCNLFHFDVQIIDKNSNPLCSMPVKSFPEKLNSLEFYKQRVSGKLRSFVVEYIFSKESYLKVGKFQNFDLAWSSDVATWVKLASESEIITIDNALVHWRKSDENISPDNNGEFPFRKLHAVTTFLLWAEEYMFSNLNINIRKFNKRIFYNRFSGYKRYLSKQQINEIWKLYYQNKVMKEFLIVWNKLVLSIFMTYKQIKEKRYL